MKQCAKTYALVEMAEITAAARLAGRESVAIFDNLHGQTTQTHLVHLARNRCKRHLLPSNMTDALQLVDDAGVGHALKTEMAHLHDDWLSKDNNLELWTAAADFPAWRKRVLITWLAARAWENVCMRFDFEAAATRLGMRMTRTAVVAESSRLFRRLEDSDADLTQTTPPPSPREPLNSEL